MKELSYCKHCKLPKHQCQCTGREWSGNYKMENLPEDLGYCPKCLRTSEIVDMSNCPFCNKNIHQHKWTGFIKIGVEGVYIICQDCGEVRLVEVNKPTSK